MDSEKTGNSSGDAEADPDDSVTNVGSLNAPDLNAHRDWDTVSRSIPERRPKTDASQTLLSQAFEKAGWAGKQVSGFRGNLSLLHPMVTVIVLALILVAGTSSWAFSGLLTEMHAPIALAVSPAGWMVGLIILAVIVTLLTWWVWGSVVAASSLLALAVIGIIAAAVISSTPKATVTSSTTQVKSVTVTPTQPQNKPVTPPVVEPPLAVSQPTSSQPDKFATKDDLASVDNRITRLKEDLVYPQEQQIAENTKRIDQNSARISTLRSRIGSIPARARKTQTGGQTRYRYRPPIVVHGHATISQREFEDYRSRLPH